MARLNAFGCMLAALYNLPCLIFYLTQKSRSGDTPSTSSVPTEPMVFGFQDMLMLAFLFLAGLSLLIVIAAKWLDAMIFLCTYDKPMSMFLISCIDHFCYRGTYLPRHSNEKWYMDAVEKGHFSY